MNRFDVIVIGAGQAGASAILDGRGRGRHQGRHGHGLDQNTT